jgi:hypothetical protein
MRKQLRRRFWVTVVLAALTAVLAGVTLFVPDWIENVFHVDPDSGNGSFEWFVVIVLFAVSVVSAFAAGVECGRAFGSARSVN